MGAKLNLNLDKTKEVRVSKINADQREKAEIKRPVTIFHSVHYKGYRFRISSGQAVEPKHWDKAKNRQQVKRTRENYSLINSILTKQQNDIEAAILKLELSGRPVSKENVVVKLPWTTAVEITDFQPVPLFQKFIIVHGSDRAARTVKGYNTTLSYLTKFEKSNTTPLTFNDFNDNFYKQFRQFLGMYDNSFGFYIKNIKTFLSWANDKGYNEFIFFKKWKIPNEDGKDHFFLKHPEIQQLAKVEVEARLDKVRDLFLIGCYCGLRYSDLSTLKPVHVQNGLITKIAVKTNEFVKIPVIPELQEIFDKYWKNGGHLPIISNQKGNEYLKELAQKAELFRQFNYVQKRNKTSTEKTYEAWEMMSWHVARHSFITNCIQFGVPQEVVRRVVGHSSFQTLKKYIQNDDDFNKKEIMKISKSNRQIPN